MGGIHAFTRSLATHLVPRGIRGSSYITGEILPIIGGYSGG
jgi:NAD(P)-dependent dehydrogenase (short-subunit alcohol dehydrogenase family)